MSFMEVEEFLKKCDSMRPSHGQLWAYRSPEEFLLRHGRTFIPGKRPDWVERGPTGMCFMTSFLLACEHPDDLVYCEGYAYNGVIPVEHAWCCDREGLVVDPTWVPTGESYFGVPLKLSYVRRIVKCNRQYGVLNNFRMRYPLYTGEHSVTEAVEPL